VIERSLHQARTYNATRTLPACTRSATRGSVAGCASFMSQATTVA